MSEPYSAVSGASEPFLAATIKTEPEDDTAAKRIELERQPLFAEQGIKVKIEIDTTICKGIKSELHTDYETKEIQVKEEPTSPVHQHYKSKEIRVKEECTSSVHQPVSNLDVYNKLTNTMAKQLKRKKQTNNRKACSSKLNKTQQPSDHNKKDTQKGDSISTSTVAQKGVKPAFFTCDICKKIFVSKEVLLDHHLVHSKRKCKFCGKQYSLQVCLNKHLHTKHYGSKDFYIGKNRVR